MLHCGPCVRVALDPDSCDQLDFSGRLLAEDMTVAEMDGLDSGARDVMVTKVFRSVFDRMSGRFSSGCCRFRLLT